MRAADADILIVPGLGDSGPDHWQSRWQRKLSTARRVVQSDWERVKLDAWTGQLAREIEVSARPVVIVAHSLGVVAALHAARGAEARIAGAFLVAPPSDSVLRELPNVDNAFAPIPRARLAFPSVLVASADDPYADFAFSRALGDDLGAQFLDAGASGHLNAESGHGPWPEGSMRFAAFVSSL
jgi:predicted alpha/beta hydrolase family esterase